MGVHPTYGLFFFITTLLISPQICHSTANSTGQINSNSVLVALDSRYTELVEKALLLPILEDIVRSHNLTIFAPHNKALERKIDPDIKRFLFEPGNLKSLQTLILSHIVPSRLYYSNWPSPSLPSLSDHRISLNHQRTTGVKLIDSAKLVRPDDIRTRRF